jgi:hypothetical protein
MNVILDFVPIANIDGRLAMTSLARGKVRLQIAPVVGPLPSAIAPSVLRLMFLGRVQKTQESTTSLQAEGGFESSCDLNNPHFTPLEFVPQRLAHVPQVLCGFAVFQWPRLTTVRAHRNCKNTRYGLATHAEAYLLPVSSPANAQRQSNGCAGECGRSSCSLR